MKLRELREAQLSNMANPIERAKKKRREKGEDINTTETQPQRKPWRTDNPI